MLSDSFDAATTDLAGDPLTIHAADDVASGDLPGPGNPANPQPVTVLEDAQRGDPSATDEGRAMLQLVHDVAPASSLCFASAFASGSVGLADNIRRLARSGGRCGADVEVDDVIYYDEPFFEDGVIGTAVNDVAGQGVHYFSSAGNTPPQQGYDTRYAPVRQDAPAVAAAGLDLSGVDPSLYSGGFHDFKPGPGVDIAQTASVSDGGGALFLQWDDPFDPDGPALGTRLLDVTGEITADAPTASYTFDGRAGQQVVIVLDAIPSGTTDLLFTLIGPDGQPITTVDTGATPERLALRLPAAGTYRVEVAGFASSVGDFTLTVAETVGGTSVTTDFNLLFFDTDGHFIGAASDLNRVSGRPIEVGSLAGPPGDVQIVIARSRAVGADRPEATRLRYQMLGGMSVEEYESPLATTVFGHNAVRGATAVAAYSVFRPNLPEWFTSPGGLMEFPFGPGGHRLARPDVRPKPELAAADGGNTTFFGFDSALDDDAFPNFFGTSAAAPHAAAIAALVLGSRGRSFAPDALRRLLERTAFRHDLDPTSATAAHGPLRITARGERGSETSGFTFSQRNPNFFTIRYSGPGSVRRITFDAAAGDPTGAGSDQAPGGLVWDPRPFDPAAPQDGGFPFTVGSTSAGITAADVTARFLRPAPPPAVDGQYERMVVEIAPGKLTRGRFIAFGVDRDADPSPSGVASEGNSADQLADGVLLPSGRVASGAVSFRAELSNGRVLAGTFHNRIGRGWTPLDGWGFVNAESAVEGGRDR